MALLLIEGFDTYATGNYTGKWNSMAGDIGAGGRNGTKCLSGTTTSLMNMSVSNKKTIIAGFALKLSATPGSVLNLLEYIDGGTVQLGTYLDTSGQILIKRGTTTISSTGYNIPIGTWVYIEFKATIDNAAGSWEVRANGVSIGSQSGIDTQQTGNAYINEISWDMFRIGLLTHYIDDVYIFDDSGSFNNDFVGDVSVEAVFPDGAGYVTQWAGFPVDGDANWQKVDETDPDGDTSFVATSGVGYIDSYTFGNLTTLSGSVYGLQVNIWGKKDDAGSRTLNAIVRPTTTTYSGGSPISIGNTYGYSTFKFGYNPETSGYWTISQINNGEFGIKQEA